MGGQDNNQGQDTPDDRHKRPLALPPSVQPRRWMYHPLTAIVIIGLVLGLAKFAWKVLQKPEILLDARQKAEDKGPARGSPKSDKGN